MGDEAIDRYLNGGVDQLYAARLLPDMDKAVGILEEKISQGPPSGLWGITILTAFVLPVSCFWA